jgi:hypothetical protein
MSLLRINPILPINLVLGLLLFSAAFKIYLLPRLHRLSPVDLLTPILLLHSLRELGLMFLFPGATLPGMPPQFAWPAALGDVLAAALAVVALLAVRRGAASARSWVWIFNVWGTVDLLLAISLAVTFGSALFLGAAYWIPAFWVPLLLASHGVVFIYLRKHWGAAA